MALEEAIYKNALHKSSLAPAIEGYRQKIVQFLKQEVLKRTATFPYNIPGFIEQQPEVTCLLCNATLGEQKIIISICLPLKITQRASV